MDYILKRQRGTNTDRGKARIVPPRRTAQLRKGGGRKDSPGWTEHKRKANRDRFNALRPLIQTALTVFYPSNATPEQLSSFNDCHRNFCKQHQIPARCVWEGPGPHHHIALGIPNEHVMESKWRARIEKHWQAQFGEPMPEKSFFWKPDINPDRIASYLSKTRDKKEKCVKSAYAWLTFSPVWETGFRALEKASSKHSISAPSELIEGRKKNVTFVPLESPEKERDTISPRYTLQTTEKEGELALAQGESDPLLAGSEILNTLELSETKVDREFELLDFDAQRRVTPSLKVLEQKSLPPEKLIAFMQLADIYLRQNIRTPGAMARTLDAIFPCGEARPYSQVLWDSMGIVNNTLRGTHDWNVIYGDPAQLLTQ